ncbi:MAG: hypothetical protein M3042_06190 [Actinomycetota bacterium]|nr:hypothetical protein [Actinomycetota bacterium]
MTGRGVRVYLEVGKTWVFAAALDWPGWCRRGRGEEAAIDALLDYTDRYAVVAGSGFAPGEVRVAGRVTGTMSTDFGAPDAHGPWDDEPLSPAEAGRQAGLLDASWRYFDQVVRDAPAELRKGPRGGGRDRDGIADHVREAERSYGRKVSVRVPPRTPWPEQRAALLGALRAGPPGGTWPARYLIRRCAWHVLDHAWEIEDRRG